MRVESRALDVDTQEPCALSVSADRIEVSSESCPSEEDEQKDDYEKCNDDADLYISRNIYSFLIIYIKLCNLFNYIISKYK